jgi:hypothetical protein
MLLLPDDALDARRTAVRGPLRPLAESLSADLTRVLDAAPAPDERKARMTRIGGRCARDGTLLAFDPFAPTTHRCPTCGAEYGGREHDEWWVMWHHLWLAERAVHAATLDLLVDGPRTADFAIGLMQQYAAQYLAWPNRDNVLGPSRPFFSTYLESIWLLQLCVALDALESAHGASVAALAGEVRDRVIAPSRALISGYPEPGSNRQVWNAAARLAASRVLGDVPDAERAFAGPHGVLSQLRDGLLADGSWYEGENYHQFAHRGLWYGLTLAETAGLSAPPALLTRFAEGFAAPFMVALPDFTLPARRDSQYAISLRQWRYAESCELGLARGDDPRLAAALVRLYDGDVPRTDTGRWRSAAESERNEPPTALSRADLGWRALLHAQPERPAAAEWAPGTVHLPAQGLAVFRRDAGRLWVGFDYGHSGGSHGHPDRLNLVVADGATRWLDDMGTGSYVERALHWYRSTLAHQAPLADGASQPRADGSLLAMADVGEVSGAIAAAGLARDLTASRAVVVDGTIVIDRLRWPAQGGTTREARVDLPFHADGEVEPPLAWTPAELHGAGGLEDGFDFLTDIERATLADREVVRLVLRAQDGTVGSAALWLVPPPGSALWRARAPGPPGRGMRRFHLLRMMGTSGVALAVLDVRGTLGAVERLPGEGVRLRAADGRVVDHLPGGPATSWRVARDGRASVTLMTERPVPTAPPDARAAETGITRVAPERLMSSAPWSATLGADHYRRSEQTWDEAGRPRAHVSLTADERRVHISLEVTLNRPTTFVPAGAENPLDNERAEINGDGVELFVVPAAGPGAGRLAGWLLVPGDASTVRVIPTSPGAAAIRVDATAVATAHGYRMTIEIARADLLAGHGDAAARTLALDVLVNEMPADRERRRGQLVLSGARGGFVYLQGDRHEAARCLPFVLPPSPDR